MATVATVAAVARLNPPGAAAILQQVRQEKQFLVVPAWPRPCRDAARDALRQLQIRAEAGVDDRDGSLS